MSAETWRAWLDSIRKSIQNTLIDEYGVDESTVLPFPTLYQVDGTRRWTSRNAGGRPQTEITLPQMTKAMERGDVNLFRAQFDIEEEEISAEDFEIPDDVAQAFPSKKAVYALVVENSILSLYISIPSSAFVKSLVQRPNQPVTVEVEKESGTCDVTGMITETLLGPINEVTMFQGLLKYVEVDGLKCLRISPSSLVLCKGSEMTRSTKMSSFWFGSFETALHYAQKNIDAPNGITMVRAFKNDTELTLVDLADQENVAFIVVSHFCKQAGIPPPMQRAGFLELFKQLDEPNQTKLISWLYDRRNSWAKGPLLGSHITYIDDGTGRKVDFRVPSNARLAQMQLKRVIPNVRDNPGQSFTARRLSSNDADHDMVEHLRGAFPDIDGYVYCPREVQKETSDDFLHDEIYLHDGNVSLNWSIYFDASLGGETCRTGPFNEELKHRDTTTI